MRPITSFACALVAALLVLCGGAGAAQAATSCGYGTNGTYGTYAGSLCWLDFSEYSDAAALTPAGQPLAVNLPGGYSLTFTIRHTGNGLRNIAAVTAPTYSQAALGASGYVGIPGRPALYAQYLSGNQANDTLTLSDIAITDSAGNPVTGWSLVAADAETISNLESNIYTTDGSAWSIRQALRGVGNTPPCGSGGGTLTGVGTTTLQCTGNTTANVGALLATTREPSTVSARFTGVSSQVSGVAFAIETASITLAKQVVGRVGPGDQFEVATTHSGGAVVGSATTSGSDTTASTGSVTVLSGVTYSLGEAAAGTTDLADYVTSWACSNANTSPTVLPSGSAVPQAITPGPLDAISCTLTNTAPPALSLVKTATPATIAGAGDTVTYSFAVTNTGGTPITDLAIDDELSPPAGPEPAISCPVTTLAVGATTTCTGTYVATQADADAGEILNTATAVGEDPDGDPVTSPPDDATVTVPSDPALTIEKSNDATSSSITLGQVITYTFVVTNTGNVTLDPVTVDETAFSGSGTAPVPSCPPGPLAPGAQRTCSATYTVTQADVDAGQIDNTAIATGTPPDGPPVDSPPDDSTAPSDPSPALSIVKSATPAMAGAAGDVISYSFLVTNTGNVTLTDIEVNETAFSGTGTPPVISCPPGAASLLPGASVTCTASYTVTQADVDAGELTNTATATGTPPSGPPVDAPPDDATVPLPPAPALSIVKSNDAGDAITVGQVITYTFLVTNTGNVTLDPVTVTETAFTGSGTAPVPSCPPGALAPGASVTCSASYTVTQADVDVGQIDNTAVATGTPPDGPPTSSPPDDSTAPSNPNPELSIVKTASPATIAAAGQTITYSFLITNTGTVTLTNVGVDETAFSGSGTPPTVTCPPEAASLAPGDDVTCSASYTATQADVDAGRVTNTAVATGTPPSGPPIDSPPDDATVTAPADPDIAIVKTASAAGFSGPGLPVTYSYLVTNTGNVTLDPVTVSDPMPGLSSVACPLASLAPGESETCTATYTTTQADVDAGALTNTGTAIGQPPTPAGGTPPDPVTADSSVAVPASRTPSLSIVKTASPARLVAAGDVIDYRFVITNTGNVTLTDVGVDETAFSGSGTPPAVSCPAGAASLAPGASITCTASYTVTQADVDAGHVSNAAIATGTPPSGPPVDSPPSTTDTPIPPAPSLALVKSASTASFDNPGVPVTYSYLVTNTGNVTLDPVTVSDPMPGLSPIACPPGALAVGASVTCTATYTTTQADVDAGQITNTATASGTPPDGPPVGSPPSTVTIPARPQADLQIVKRVAPETATPGRNLTYTLAIRNNGPSAAVGVVVSDPLPDGLTFVSASDGCTGVGAAVTCTLPGLAVGEERTFTVTASVASSVDHAVENTATVRSDTPDPDPSNNTSTVRVPTEGEADLVITKSPSTSAPGPDGQVIYTLSVTNRGPSDATGVQVSDPGVPGLILQRATASQGRCAVLDGKVACALGTLAVGGSAQVLVTARVIGAAAVTLINTASVQGDQRDPTPENNHDPAPVTPSSSPQPVADLVISKRANRRSATAGERITYTIRVTNKGPDAAPDTTVTDTFGLPSTIVSVRSTAGTCRRTQPLRCSLGTLARGATVRITVVAVPRVSGTLRNAVSTTSDAIDPHPEDNLATVTTRLAKPALRLAKAVDRTPIRAGERVSYTITVSNPANVAVRNVAVCDRLPAGLVFVAGTPKPRLDRGRQCWTVRVLGAGKRRTFRLTVRALPGASGNKVNRVTATSPDARSARAERTVRIIGGPVKAGGVTG